MKSQIKAICHDNRFMISGTIQAVTPTGCDLVCDEAYGTAIFPRKAHVLMNLFDPQSNQTITMEVRLTDVARKDGHWVYRVRWKSMPALLAPSRLQIVSKTAA